MSSFKSLALLLAAQLANAQGSYPVPPVAGLPVSILCCSVIVEQITDGSIVPWYVHYSQRYTSRLQVNRRLKVS
jgi:hypothetical protein